jgi:hypothetical protein
MVNVLESTLASTYGEVIVNYGTGSLTRGFSLDSASALLLPHGNIEIFLGSRRLLANNHGVIWTRLAT